MATRHKGVGAAGTSAPVRVIDQMTSTSNSGVMSVPAHDAGDMLLVVLGDNNKTVPTLLSGFTNIITGTFDSTASIFFDRCFRLQYIIDTDNSISSLSYATNLQYGEGLVIRNASGVARGGPHSDPVASVLSDNSDSGTRDPESPSLSGLTASNGNALIGGHYGIQDANVDGVSGPFDDFVSLSGMAYTEGHNLSSVARGAYISYDNSIVRLTWCCEIERG